MSRSRLTLNDSACGHGVIVIVGGITENAILEQFRSSGVMPAGA